MTVKISEWFWKEIEQRKSQIVSELDKAIEMLKKIKNDNVVIGVLNDKDIQDSIAQITTTKEHIIKEICRNNELKMNVDHLFKNDNAFRLCQEAFLFAQQLRCTIELTANREFFKNPNEKSIATLKNTFSKLESTAKGSFFSPKAKVVISSLAISLIYPAVLSLFWAIIFPSTFIASVGLPILLPILIAVLIIGTVLTYNFRSEKVHIAAFETTLRNDRINTASKLRLSLFAPIDERASNKMKKQHQDQASSRTMVLVKA